MQYLYKKITFLFKYRAKQPIENQKEIFLFIFPVILSLCWKSQRKEMPNVTKESCNRTLNLCTKYYWCI